MKIKEERDFYFDALLRIVSDPDMAPVPREIAKTALQGAYVLRATKVPKPGTYLGPKLVAPVVTPKAKPSKPISGTQQKLLTLLQENPDGLTTAEASFALYGKKDRRGRHKITSLVFHLRRKERMRIPFVNGRYKLMKTVSEILSSQMRAPRTVLRVA